MPAYDYRCPEHGPETIVKPMAHATDPEYCPRCEKLMERVYVPVNGRVQRGTEKYHSPR